MGLRATPTMCCRPYFRNVSMYPSAIYPQTGDSEIDSLVYTLTVRGPAASALPPYATGMTSRLTEAWAVMRCRKLDTPCSSSSPRAFLCPHSAPCQ